MSQVASGGAGAIVRQGHLRKLKTMKKKYFVVRAETHECSARLEYYESEKKFRSGAAPRRAISLKSCYNITRRLDLKQKHVIALFTREEQFCVVAENEQDLHLWLSAILRQHRADDASEELQHPIQHVWQVNVQKKGLGASKNIQGLYNLCLTDKTLALVKIKSHNNIISDLCIPERVEYSLKNIRRCGDSECFFYMEVGRQTSTGAGELWMHTDDSNIAQSMHSTIYHAMRNCAKESENDKDHVIMPKTEGPALPARRQTFSDGRARPGLNNEGLCVGACIRQCVCAATTYSIDDSASAIAPLATNAENQPPNSSLIEKIDGRVTMHQRTVSLPSACIFQPTTELRIYHARTRSAPLSGDEVDSILEKPVRHSSCKAVNEGDTTKKGLNWSRRASACARLSKLSPAHSKSTHAAAPRSRCDSMPSRISDADRVPPRLTSDFVEGAAVSRDDVDACGMSASEWHRTPRIPEEPDYCEMGPRDLMSTSRTSSSVQHSRTSSMGFDEVEGVPVPLPPGYVPMAPAHEPMSTLVSAQSGSVCSGTPSTDPRFSEYQLDPATSHIIDEERVTRAYSVGSRPTISHTVADTTRHRAYSVGARTRGPPPARASSSAPLLADDLMELDFSNNSTPARVVVARTPPRTAPFPRAHDEYVDMSPRTLPDPARIHVDTGYVDMKPGEALQPASVSSASEVATTPDGYVEMNYSKRPDAPTRPIAIANVRSPVPNVISPQTPADDKSKRNGRTPLGSQTIFPLSLDSPASPAKPEDRDLDVLSFDDEPHHPLTTVREISEEGRRSPEMSSSPSYVTLARTASKPIAAPPKLTEPPLEELSCNPTATKNMSRLEVNASESNATLVKAGSGAPARFSVGDEPSEPTLHYAALDLEPKPGGAAPTPRLYTQIDFARSEKLHADAN